ncbi:guanylyl and adenylyl cyclase family member [Volvox carteri f. nagariensis]|uniref:guanylate cyclase n=1 Tax=Volvox carteri f. nagariensis TaxID=3068 RepID=D8U0R1_VOLCA|nr:guanylyl and adenylyl cyclase family member [Volvox carteri f. nagariensis]EFJ46683.1 guanylyl and adenylyl cyclase family member [Volvox carteri f. nagariensis]|eukprot:XP_002952212.1 guanylyl and adenylyl cyclase family member [Volvox carteri f. nagariensis]
MSYEHSTRHIGPATPILHACAYQLNYLFCPCNPITTITNWELVVVSFEPHHRHYHRHRLSSPFAHQYAVEAFICDSFGRDAWLKIIKQAHVDCNWVSSCPYPDKVTYDLVITGASILGVTVPQALEAYGQYFVNYVIKQGYTRLLRSLGSNIAEFLANLNNLHLHLTMGFPSMVAPAFRVEQVTSTCLLLHYHSIRPALWPIVSGVLKGASKFLFDHGVELELVASRDAGDCDHEIFRVTYPHQESLAHWDNHGAALASSYSMTKEFFYEMFPFHIILDRDCRVVQCGRVMARLFGKTLTRGSPVSDTFKLRHPYIPFEYDKMVLESSSLYLLKSLETGLEFKGQMVQSSMPDGLPVLLFLGSPRVANLEEMSVHGIFLSDIPLHDMSRDFVLLAEQRQASLLGLLSFLELGLFCAGLLYCFIRVWGFRAEADLKERFEKMAVELRVANERLEQATRWLDEERQRSDALLYRMLPADIATDLREGKKVEAISYPEVTILFSDMVGFTTTSAKSTPEEVYNMLNEMYDKFDELVDEFPDVYKLETIGDAYFLVCNMTTHCEKHVDVVIDFAVHMQALARKVKNAQGEPVQIRIGIHTGPVVGGVLGAKTPRFSIYGDTVNVASRMESHGLPGKIHISEAAYNRIVDKDKYAVRERGNIAVKGRGNMTTYLIGGTNDDWLLRHTSLDLQVDGVSGHLRDGSFIVTASGRSAESLAPSRTGGMEAIKEGDEDRSSRNNGDVTMPGSNASITNSTSNNRDVSIRYGGGATGAAACQSGVSHHNSSSGQMLQLISAARGSTEGGLVAGGIDAFISPQAAAAATAAVAMGGAAIGGGGGSGAGSFRDGPSGLVRDGSLREGLPPSGGHAVGVNRDTSFRAVYARGAGRPGTSSANPLAAATRSGAMAGSSLNSLMATGSVGGAAAANQSTDGEHGLPSESHGVLVDFNSRAAGGNGGSGGGGNGNNSPHHPVELSPLSRPELSGGSGAVLMHRTGIVLARSATAKTPPVVSTSLSGMPPTVAYSRSVCTMLMRRIMKP